MDKQLCLNSFELYWGNKGDKWNGKLDIKQFAKEVWISAMNDIEKKKLEIEENSPHYSNEVICLKCLHRYIAVYPVGTPLKMLECGGCGEQGYIILTGENV